MELSLAAQCDRIRACMGACFFCCLVECAVRPPVQDLAYKPQHNAACIAPERRREEELEFGGDRPVQVDLAFDQKLEQQRMHCYQHCYV